MKALAKRVVGHGLFAARLDALLLRNTAVIVAFHRVRPTDGSDSLTVDVGAFGRYCRFFKRYFRVVPLRELVQALRLGRPLDRHLAITFDDGYRDNYENAAPVLEALSLPATFFVVSTWIDTDVVPWWDRARGERHPWMTWDDLRALRRKGFEVGAHTRTHVDLGRVFGPDARDEILGARQELEARLAAPVESFAYPYGGRRHLTDANRVLVREAGFGCCCAGYGGVNSAGADPFDLRRVPISPWYASPEQFGLEVALGRSVLSA